jgi:hypothetical protein
MLVGLADGGAELAALYVQHAKDQAYSGKPGTGPAPEIATAYSDVSRSVRQTVMLAQKLTAPAPKPSEPAPDRIVIRKQIIRKCCARPGRPAGAPAGFVETAPCGPTAEAWTGVWPGVPPIRGPT